MHCSFLVLLAVSRSVLRSGCIVPLPHLLDYGSGRRYVWRYVRGIRVVDLRIILKERELECSIGVMRRRTALCSKHHLRNQIDAVGSISNICPTPAQRENTSYSISGGNLKQHWTPPITRDRDAVFRPKQQREQKIVLECGRSHTQPEDTTLHQKHDSSSLAQELGRMFGP